MVDISLKRGSRGFITGTSGSGKSTLALALCEAMPAPLVIVDTKYDPGIGAWAKRNKIKIETKKMPDWSGIKNDVVVRPPEDWLANPDDIDWWLGQAFKCKFVPSIYIDEGYQVGATPHKMGKGVTGLWTRGRVFGFRTLIGAQRPNNISPFAITESDVLYIGALPLETDRQKVYAATGEKDVLIKQPKKSFLYIRRDEDGTVQLKPLDITKTSQYDKTLRSDTLTRVPKAEESFVERVRNFFTG